MATADLTVDEREAEPTRGKPSRRWLKRTLLILLAIIVLLLVIVIGLLLYFHIPQNAAAMAAKGVCSGTFVAGRQGNVFEEDIAPESPAFKLVSTSIDRDQKSVTGKFLGLFEARASLLDGRGCVLFEDPEPSSTAYKPAPPNPAPWPQGDAAVPQAQWGPGISAPQLEQVLNSAMAGAGDPNGSNPRGVAVVQNGRLLAARQAAGFPQGTALMGWSMTKSVAAMLFYKKATEAGLDISRPVVDAFPAGKAPAWVAQWQQDDRKKITISDLAFMRSGLDISESYQPWGDVVEMLDGQPDMAAWAAGHGLAHDPASFWLYTSGGSNIFSRVTLGQFASEEAYWDYTKTALLDPIGVKTATLETDTSGTWVGSSYLWASAEDWARLGQLWLNDGKWGDQQVLPPGWMKLSTTPAMPDGEGHGYGFQTWLWGDPADGECKTYPGVPADTYAMEGHWGQIVAVIPSRKAVISRLGWTVNGSFDGCQLVSDVVATLPR